MKGFAALLCGFVLGGVQLAHADSIPVRYLQGASHGFLLLRDLDGKVLAVGDSMQVVQGDRVISRLTFHFRDGSLDDDQAVYTQRGVFRLLRDHHVQRGPSFPKPMDMSIDVASGMVTTREPGKDGQEKVKSEHVDLPPDLANGIFLTLIENIRPTTEKTTLPFVVSLNGARVIQLAVKPADAEKFYVVANARKALRFEVRVELGGVVGVVAPLIGKQPHDFQFWILEGTEAPGFVREEGQFYEGGPVWRIDPTRPRIP